MNFKIDFTVITVLVDKDVWKNCVVISLSLAFIIYLASAGLLATSGDITMTWTSPMYEKLYSNDTSVNPLEKPITPDQDSWIGSLINIGAMIGPLPFSFIAHKFGRKIGLLCIAIPHITAYITFAFAKNVYLFYFGRLLGGLGVGGGYTLLPMYIAEVSDDSNRGILSVTLLAFWCFGNMLPCVIGPFMSILMFNLLLACFPIIFFVLFLYFGIETPYYWLSKDNPQKAEESLMALRTLNKVGVEKELIHIKKNLKSEEGGHFSDIIRNPGLRRALIISLILILFQQLSGNNAIMFYVQPIFELSGTKISSDISSLIFGFALFISSFTVQFLVNRFGRKTLTIISCVVMLFALSLMGSFFYVKDSTDISTASIFWIPIFSLILYIFGYNAGMAVLPWTISSELFPTNVKQISASATSIACWLSSFVLTRLFNDMINFMGSAGTFWFFAVSSLVAAIFTVIFVPETKGKSFRAIQAMLDS